MQSIEFKRFPIHLLAILIAAIAAVVMVLTATGTIFDSSDSDPGRPSAIVQPKPSNQSVSTERMHFLEWNTNLPETGLGIVADAPAPAVERPAVVSAERTRFLELNLNLPDTSTPDVRSFEESRFLEMNTVLPGNTAPILPYPDPSDPGASRNAY